MKKLFALFMVVAMLSVAATAMADVTVTAAPGNVTVQAGSSVTATLSVSGGNHPRGTAAYTPSVSWATVTGNTITFAPPASLTAGTRDVVVEVIETYTSNTDIAGHGSATLTDVGSVTIPVTITASTSGGGTTANTTTKAVIITVVEVIQSSIKRDTITKTVVAASVQEATSITTFADVVKTVAQQVAKALTNTIEKLASGSSEMASVAAKLSTWTTAAKTAEVQAAAEEAIATPTQREFMFPGVPVEQTVPQNNDQLQPAVSSTGANASTADKLVAASKNLGNNERALSAGDAVSPKRTGTYKFPQLFAPKLYYTKIKGDRGRQGGSVSDGSFTASAADNTGVNFVNSAGEIVDYIPGDDDPNVMPGYVNMMVVMMAGEVYEPVVYTTEDDMKTAATENTYMDSADLDAVSADALVVTEVEYTTEKQKITVEVDADGNETQIGEAEEIVNADATATATMAAAMGVSASELKNAYEVEGVTFPDYDAKNNTDYANDENHPYFIAGDVPAMGNLTTGTYYVETNIGTLPTGRTLKGDAKFEFYPKGFNSAAAPAKVFNAEGNDTVDVTDRPEDVFGQKAYLVFKVSNDQIVAANYDVSAPALAVAINPATTPVTDTIVELRNSGYINQSNEIQDYGFADNTKPSFTDDTVAVNGYYTKTIRLKFPVTNWTISVTGNGSLSASEVTKNNSSFDVDGAYAATVKLSRADITKDKHTVTLSVTPTGTSTPVTADLGTVTGNPQLAGAGSSSGGCSAGFAGLALAVLGSFVLTRKR